MIYFPTSVYPLHLTNDQFGSIIPQSDKKLLSRWRSTLLDTHDDSWLRRLGALQSEIIRKYRHEAEEAAIRSRVESYEKHLRTTVPPWSRVKR